MHSLIVGCLLLLGFLQASIAEDFHEPPPWEPAPRLGPTLTQAATEAWYAKHQRLLERAKTGRNQIVFLGDSNTEAWDNRGLDTWNQLFAPYGALNLGVSGDTTQNVLWRIANGALDGRSPKVVVLLIGAGEFLTPRDRDLWTPEQDVRGITAVVDAVRCKLPEAQIIDLALFPAGQPTQPVRHQQVAVNDVLARAALGPHATYVDLGPYYLRPDGTEVEELYQPDGLHLSTAGYAVEGQLLEPRIKELVH
jgi:lysophospholipase L1-like esterase